jgi:hypothetical protein
MKPTLPVVLLLIALSGRAQDVEPTMDRAMSSLVRELVAELPYRVENGEALAIDLEPYSDKRIAEVFVARLLREGFRIEAASSRNAGAVPIRVVTKDSSDGLGSIRVTAGDFVAERRFGRASWVDQPRANGTIVAVGVSAESAQASLASAREKIATELRKRFPNLAGKPDFERYASREPVASFVAQRTVAGRKQFEAYAMAEPSFEHLTRAERSVRDAARRVPWTRAAMLAASGCVLWLLYLRADLRTRGFKTKRLRLLFGTLFAALSMGLWSLPL